MNPRVIGVVEQANALCLRLRVERLEATTWVCIICENRSPRGTACQFCTSCACDDCGAIGKLEERCCGDMLCPNCMENRDISAAERADEDAFTSYWEGTAPDYVYEAMAARGGR